MLNYLHEVERAMASPRLLNVTLISNFQKKQNNSKERLVKKLKGNFRKEKFLIKISPRPCNFLKIVRVDNELFRAMSDVKRTLQSDSSLFNDVL